MITACSTYNIYNNIEVLFAPAAGPALHFFEFCFYIFFVMRVVANSIFHLLLLHLVISLFAAAADNSIDVGNRQVEVSVSASSWPTIRSSPICEVWAYLQDDGLEWIFLNHLLEELEKSPSGIREDSNIDDYAQLVLQAANATYKDDSSFHLHLLSYTLALRAYSPTCELYRTLASDLIIDSGLFDETHPPEALVLLYPSGIVLDDVRYLSEAIQSIHHHVEEEETPLSFLLPGETPRPSSSNTTTNITAVLYANVGTLAFQQWYDAILSYPQISFILRHMGSTSAPNSSNIIEGHDKKTYLQGYGVKLDIRNVEYTVFDSKDESTDNVDTTKTNNNSDNDAMLLHSGEYIAGVNITLLLQRCLESGESSAEKLVSPLLLSLSPIHAIQTRYESSVPQYMYEKRYLSLQAASAVSISNDALFALKDISQNLPSRARYLQQISRFEDIKNEADFIWNHIPLLHENTVGMRSSSSSSSTHSAFYVFVNGKHIPVERPSFNMFDFTNVIRQEHDLLSSMLKKVHLPTPEAYHFLQKCIMGGEKALVLTEPDEEVATRIDVGRGGSKAILFLNNIEQDSRYRSWSTSLQPLLYGYGGPPTRIRRNLFTLLIVIDPLSATSSSAVLEFAAQLVQASVPIRIGLVIVSDSDLVGSTNDETWEPRTPLKTSDSAQTYQLSELIYQLFFQFEQRGFFGMTLSFLLSWSQRMESQVSQTPTVKELLDFYSQFVYENTYQYTRDVSVNEIYDRSLTQTMKKPNYLTNYKSALAFASSKGLHPGVAFLNGRPLPTSPEEFQSISRIFGEEISFLIKMMMLGELTDDKPRSLYAKLLSGNHVYSKYHPMLSQSKKVYRTSTANPSTARKMFFPASQGHLKNGFNGVEKPIVPVVIEGVFNLCKSNVITEDLKLLERLSSMSILPDLVSKLHPDEDTSQTVLVPSFHFQFIYDENYELRTPPCASLSQLLEVMLKSDEPSVSREKLTEFLEVIRFVNVYLSSDSDFKAIFGAAKISARSFVENPLAITLPLIRQSCSANSLQNPGQGQSLIISVNSRVLSPINRATFSVEDIKLVLQLELERSEALALSLKEWYFSDSNKFSHSSLEAFSLAVSDASGFLGQVTSSESGNERMDVSMQVNNLIDSLTQPNSLVFSWNSNDENGVPSKQSLMVEVTAIIDPLNKDVQRLMPILEAVRDKLHLPLRLVLAPTFDSSRDPLPLSSYYRFVAGTGTPAAIFSHLPKNHVLTMRLDVPEGWNVQQISAIQDTDNLRCDLKTNACGDTAAMKQTCAISNTCSEIPPNPSARNVAVVEYALITLLFFGQCYDLDNGVPPAGLQLTLSKASFRVHGSQLITKYLSRHREELLSGNISETNHFSESIVMHNLGYFQLRTLPGIWEVKIAKGSRGEKIFRIKNNGDEGTKETAPAKMFVLKDFLTSSELLRVERKAGFEKTPLLIEQGDSAFDGTADVAAADGENEDDGMVHVFSLATGHLYERFLKIMMLSVTKRTSSKVKFWLFENFLSPSFKASAAAMARDIGCEIEYVTYKWPEWLRGQQEKQRIIWGYKILFLDVLFPLRLKKIIYVDADQVIRSDLKELWDLDLDGAPYGFTPFCDSRNETIGYQFWRPKDSFWARHLQGRPYHISALYVVDLATFRKQAVGDKLRSQYQTLSADPNSLANLDQDLPNYSQHHVRIFSLPQEWLWCESWCSDETKASAKTIDLCNNPRYKEPKLSMAKRIISGDLFKESWIELDQEVRKYDVFY